MSRPESYHTKHLPPTGTDVYDARDPRHVGRYEGCLSNLAIVTWHETRWRSDDIPIRHIRKAGAR